MSCVISILGGCREDGASPNGKKFRVAGPSPIFRRERLHVVPSTHLQPADWRDLHQPPPQRAD